MYTNCENFGHKNWVYDIKTLLSKLGFLEIWHKQEIDRTLLAILKQRIYANIENSRKCSFYTYLFCRYLIYGFNIQYYLRKSLPMKYQKSIAKMYDYQHIVSP